MRYLIILIGVMTLLFSGCQKELLITNPDNAEYFSYQGFTAEGELFASGSLFFSQMDTARVEGVWFISKKKEVENIGPQIGRGTLVGQITEGRIVIDLNPEMRDNNVILMGTLENDSIVGKWQWVTFAGPTSEGPFEAHK